MSRVWMGPELKVSNSEIQTFKDCRRKWWFVYYRELGLKRSEDEVSGPRSLGSRIHLALEGYYTRDENPLEILKDIYEHEMEEARQNLRVEADIDLIKKEYDLAHAMLTGFIEWLAEEGIDDGLELVAVEDVIEVKSHIENVKLRGKLDQRWVRKSDGARLFRDFKTVGDLTTPMKTLHMDEQMKFYQLLEYIQSLEANGGADPADGAEPAWRTDGALYTMLRKVKRTATAKPPFYGQLEVHHNMTEIRNMWLRVAKVIDEIVDARLALDSGQSHHYVVPPRPSRDCTWKCPVFPICSMFDDGSNVEGAIEVYYEHRDPHERYTKEEVKGEE